MTSVLLVRPLKNTNLFRKNQRCWIKYTTGQLAVCVVGKHRGKGRYIQGWLHAPKEYDPKLIKEIEVEEEFAKRLMVF